MHSGASPHTESPASLISSAGVTQGSPVCGADMLVGEVRDHIYQVIARLADRRV